MDKVTQEDADGAPTIPLSVDVMAAEQDAALTFWPEDLTSF
jgi:hypothetical protein